MFLCRVTAPLLLSLFFVSITAIATQVLAPNCTSAEWDWTLNSLSQSPCTVVAYMIASCLGVSYSISPLTPGTSYPGPTSTDDDNLCECNTVVYSLFSACDACQGEAWIAWSEYITNCTETLHPSLFPITVPSQTRVPLWALLDVTSEGFWSSSKSYAVGDAPEKGPGSTLGPLSVSLTTAAIVGSVVGGIVGFSIIFVAIFYLRRRRSPAPSKSAEPAGINAPQLRMDEISPAATTKLYNPNDPTTFPGQQDNAHSPDVPPQVPTSLHVESGSTMPDKQTSLPQAAGYHGLPTV